MREKPQAFPPDTEYRVTRLKDGTYGVEVSSEAAFFDKYTAGPFRTPAEAAAWMTDQKRQSAGAPRKS